MDIQENFTEASRIYLGLEDLIREMFKLNKNNQVTLDEALKSYDILVQMLFLYLAALDDNVSKSELNYIKQLTVEEDILEYLNKVVGKNYTWEGISSSHMSSKEYKEFLYMTNNILQVRINSFIMLIASIDALTKNDYSYKLSQGLKELVLLFVEGNSKKRFETEADEILNTIFLFKYKSLKSIFSLNGDNMVSDLNKDFSVLTKKIKL